MIIMSMFQYQLITTNEKIPNPTCHEYFSNSSLVSNISIVKSSSQSCTSEMVQILRKNSTLILVIKIKITITNMTEKLVVMIMIK